MILMTNLFMLQAPEPYLFSNRILSSGIVRFESLSDHDKPEFAFQFNGKTPRHTPQYTMQSLRR